MHRPLLAFVLVLGACSNSDPPPNDRTLNTVTHNEDGERYCSVAGNFDDLLCNYHMDELDDLAKPSPVRITGYLLDLDNQLVITEWGDGSGVRIGISSLPDDAEAWFIKSIVGFRVGARGMYDPSKGAIDLTSIGQIAFPAQASPDFPAPDERNTVELQQEQEQERTRK